MHAELIRVDAATKTELQEERKDCYIGRQGAGVC